MKKEEVVSRNGELHRYNTLGILPDPNPENYRVDYYYLFIEKSRVDYLDTTKSVENPNAKSFNKNTQAR